VVICLDTDLTGRSFRPVDECGRFLHRPDTDGEKPTLHWSGHDGARVTLNAAFRRVSFRARTTVTARTGLSVAEARPQPRGGPDARLRRHRVRRRRRVRGADRGRLGGFRSHIRQPRGLGPTHSEGVGRGIGPVTREAPQVDPEVARGVVVTDVADHTPDQRQVVGNQAPRMSRPRMLQRSLRNTRAADTREGTAVGEHRRQRA